MLEITSHRNGEILNYRHGIESESSLLINVSGIADPQSHVIVNGIPAQRNDRMFTAQIELTERVNHVTAIAKDKFGTRALTIVLVWDKKSFKRYCVRIDDNSFFFTDLVRERPKHLFDHFYLKELKRLHEKYDSKFILKCFYSDAHDKDHIDLSQVPDCYKSEFDDNASWLHLAFHALSEFPDRPYQHCTGEQLAHDYDLTTNELRRIAGDNAVTAPTNVHWAMLDPSLFHVMHERGVKILTASGFMSNRLYVEGKVQELPTTSCDIGFFYEQDVAHYMLKRRAFYDPDHDLFLSKSFFCFNIDTPTEIEEKIKKVDAEPDDVRCDMLEAIGHEQYAYPRYFK